MHILIIPSEKFIPSNNPLLGIFQFQQGQILKNDGFKVGFLSVNVNDIRNIFKSNKYNNQEYILGDSLVLRYWIKSLLPARFFLFNSLILKYYCFIGLRKYISLHGRPDLIYAHNIHFAGYLSYFLNKKFKIPYIILEHNSQFLRGGYLPFSKKKREKIINRSRAFCTVSKFLMDYFSNYYEIKTSKNILNNAIDFNFEIKTEIKKDNSMFEFIHIGSLDSNKNQTLLLDAFSKFKFQNNLRLTIVGNGPNAELLLKHVTYLGLNEKVRFIKRLERDDVKNILLKSNCLVLCSKIETFGVVLIEAAACGCVLLSTDSGGPLDIINEHNGLIVPQNADDLYLGMKYIIDNYSKYNINLISQNVLTNFGKRNFVHHFKTILKVIET
jgi:glycosyltransferase involved in cell wall biosynthesis